MRGRLFRKWACVVVVAATGLTGRASAADTPAVPEFREVYEVLRTNLPGISEAELNRAAVQGLLQQLHPQVTWVGQTGSFEQGSNALPAFATATYDGAYGYIRLGELNREADETFQQAVNGLSTSNRLKGLVLDLRFAQGDSYAAAVGIVDAFLTTEQPLMDWGEGLKHSTAKPKGIGLPLTVLVNQKTAGASEALAGMLRQHSVGLVIGQKTAGLAGMAREVALSNGQRLRIASSAIKLGKGDTTPLNKVTPDIVIQVNAEDEIAWMADAYKPLVRAERPTIGGTNDTLAASTNRPRRRINEAELVRMQREGQSLDFESAVSAKEATSTRPTVQDPVLARALDLLKGLSVMRQFRGG